MQINGDYNFSVLNQIGSNIPSTQKTGFSAVLKSTLKSDERTLDDIFEQAAREYKVPVGLLKAVGKAESNFDTNAVSSCGAQGIMQLMPSTAKALGVTNAFDAEQNIKGGAKYLKQMLDRYNGDVKLALAAYNAGSGNVAKYGGIPPFKETQNYVEKVMRYAGENYSLTQTVKSSIGKEISSYSDIINNILGFEEYTKEDYRIFAELLKMSLKTPSFFDYENDVSRNLFNNNLNIMY